jgi:hypothetical protein
MKTRNSLTALAAFAAVLTGWLSAFAVPTAVTNSLTQIDVSGVTTLTSNYWTDGQVAHAGADYLIDLKDTIRLPGAAFTFEGNSLQLGTTTVQAYFVQKLGNLTFANDGLFLKNVYWGHWEGGRNPTIAGKVTVLAPEANEKVKFSSSSANSGLTFTGAWSGDAASSIEVYDGSNAQKSEVIGDYTFSLLGDLSQFFGTIRAYKGAIVGLGATTFPGSLVMDNTGAAGVLRVTNETARVTIGSLTLTAGTMLETAARVASGTEPATNSGIRVTSALDVTGPVYVAIPSNVWNAASVQSANGELHFPVLTKASDVGNALTLSDFVATNLAATVGIQELLPSLAVATDATSGDAALEFVRKPVVVLTEEGKTFLTNNCWSDALAPHAGAVYYSNKQTLRSTYGSSAETFLGDALVLDSTLVLQGSVAEIPALYMKKRPNGSGGYVNASIANWHANGDKTTNTFAVGGTKVLKCGRLVLMEESTFNCNGIGSLVRFDAPIEGTGKLYFSVNDGEAGAYLELAGDNSKWTGKLHVNAITGKTRTAGDYANTCEVLFRKPESLGGPLAAFDVSSVILQTKSVLRPLETMTWNEPTRGLDVWPLGGGIRTDTNVVFTVMNPIRLQGTLGKLGAGTLVIGGKVTLKGGEGTTPVIDVLEGGVRTCAKNAVDGVSFTFGTTGAIEADVTATGDAATFGLYDVATDAPFDRATAPNGRVPVRLRMPDDYDYKSPRHVSAAICTVSAAAAANLGTGAFSVARPKHCRTYVTAETNADGTVTYTAHADTTGLMLVIR